MAKIAATGRPVEGEDEAFVGFEGTYNQTESTVFGAKDIGEVMAIKAGQQQAAL